MLYYAALFFVIALIAALFGFGGVAAGAAEIAEDSLLHFPRTVRRFARRRTVQTRTLNAGRISMLKWALIFFLISIVAGFFGFTGVAAGAASIAKILFFIFLVIAIGIVVLAVIAGKAIF